MLENDALLILVLSSFFLIFSRKPKTLTRDDLVLPWRPLYDVAREVARSKLADLGMRLYSP